MKKVFEILSMVTLLIWGGLFVYFFASGRVDTYLTPTFRPFVLVAGIGLILLGGFNLIFANRKTGACIHDHAGGDEDHSHAHCDHNHVDDEHEHHHHEEATASSLFFALLVLLVPLLTAAKFSPDRYSSEYTIKWAEIETEMHRLKQRKAAQKSNNQTVKNGGNPHSNPNNDSNAATEEFGEFTLENLKEMVPQTSAGDFLLDIPQIFYTAGDTELMNVMEGISVQAEAQVIEDTMSEDSHENRLRAFRMMIECCAADGRPLSIPIDFTEAVPPYKEMGWYKIIGRLHFHKAENAEYTPILQIKTFEEIPEPEDWMSVY